MTKNLLSTAIVIAAVCVLLLSTLPGEEQEVTSTEQSPELKVLGSFVGTWKWKIATAPDCHASS